MSTIIAKSNNGFLVEMTGEEIAKLCGFSYESSMPEKGGSYCRRERIEIGDKINVAGMFDYLRSIENTVNDIRGVEQKLRVAAGMLAKLPEPLTRVEVKPDTVTPKA